jgi:small subunit ribosomal protein S6
MQRLSIPHLNSFGIEAITQEEKILRSYQTVLILKPDLDDAGVNAMIEKVGEYFKKYGGSTLNVQNWGKKRLAYRVKKNRFGIYLNFHHTCENVRVVELEKDFFLNDSIIKFLVLRLTDKELERALNRINEVDTAEGLSDDDDDDSATDDDDDDDSATSDLED